ncbi:MAG: electron transfer flavoprotein subunit alpha/FixB family protein [Anaerolineales bacterium]
MMDRLHVYIDHQGGTVVPASWETLGAARGLADSTGGSVTAILIGSGLQEVAELAFGYGADEVWLVEDEMLADFRAEPYANALTSLLEDAEVLLLPDSGRTRDAAGMVAVDLDTGVVPDVTELIVEDDHLKGTRPIYAGKLLSTVTVPEAKPQIFTLRSRAFEAMEPDTSASGSVQTREVELPPAKTEIVGYKEGEETVSLSDAAVIVSGGRGTANTDLEPPADVTDEKEVEIWRAHQGFELVGELASVLGGAVGASRAAVDAGYIPYAHQVGQTGKVVSPDLYIACGISGAIQHLAGMRTAKTIVAINTDPDAPIFKLSRFGVVGDLYEVLPPLIEALREKLD